VSRTVARGYPPIYLGLHAAAAEQNQQAARGEPKDFAARAAGRPAAGESKRRTTASRTSLAAAGRAALT
jgi:hypothetical protein